MLDGPYAAASGPCLFPKGIARSTSRSGSARRNDSAEGDLREERDAVRIDGGGSRLRRPELAGAGEHRGYGEVAGSHAAERPASSHRRGAGQGERGWDGPAPRGEQLATPRARARDRPRRSLRAAGRGHLRWNGGGQPDGGVRVRLPGAGIVRAHARSAASVCGPDHFLCSVRARPEPPMISGVITTRHVIRHAAIIVREFGAAAYLRYF